VAIQLPPRIVRTAMQHVQAQLARQHEATAPSAVGTHDEALRTSSGHTMTGKTDLLLRLFDSDFFDEWIAVSYLWRSKTEVLRARAPRPTRAPW